MHAPAPRDPDHVHAFEPSPQHGGFVCGCGEVRESRSVAKRLAVQRREPVEPVAWNDWPALGRLIARLKKERNDTDDD